MGKLLSNIVLYTPNYPHALLPIRALEIATDGAETVRFDRSSRSIFSGSVPQ